MPGKRLGHSLCYMSLLWEIKQVVALYLSTEDIGSWCDNLCSKRAQVTSLVCNQVAVLPACIFIKAQWHWPHKFMMSTRRQQQAHHRRCALASIEQMKSHRLSVSDDALYSTLVCKDKSLRYRPDLDSLLSDQIPIIFLISHRAELFELINVQVRSLISAFPDYQQACCEIVCARLLFNHAV